MSLSLRESCVMYERYCRRHADTPTFEEFNTDNYTCLPTNADAFTDFKRVLVAARRSAGVPVTRRLPSLLKRFSTEEEAPAIMSGRASLEQVAETAPSVQVRTSEKAFKSSVPVYESGLRNNVRPPELEAPKWSLDGYKEAVRQSKSVLLKESKNLIVHLVPDKRSDSLESLACKLTKSTWESLRGKSDAPLKMRDGSTLELESISMDECDLAEFVRNRKKKVAGPYYVRFSRI